MKFSGLAASASEGMNEREVNDYYLGSITDPRIREHLTLLVDQPLQVLMTAAMNLQHNFKKHGISKVPSRQNPTRTNCPKCNWHHNKGEKCPNVRCPLNKAAPKGNDKKPFKSNEVDVQQGEVDMSDQILPEEPLYDSDVSGYEAQDHF